MVEGVLAANLRNLWRSGDGDLQFEAPACLRAVNTVLAPNTRLRIAADERADWISWAALANRITSANVGVDVGQVRELLLQPRSVEISSSDQEDDVAEVEEPAPLPLPAEPTEAQQLRNDNARLKRKLASVQRKAERLVVKNRRLTQAVLEENTELRKLVLRGDAARYFSPRGGMGMAVRRLASGVSANRFGISNLMDVWHTTVTRWEIIFVAALQAWRRQWYTERERWLQSCEGLGEQLEGTAALKMRFVTHVHRGDATNTMRFKVKYHNSQTQSTYYEIDASDGTSWAEVMASKQHMTSLADVIPVDGQDALHTYAMYEKQVGSIGCPRWKRDETNFDNSRRLQRLWGVVLAISTFFGGDCGGDEDKSRQMATAACEDDPHSYVMSGPCLLHQYHLMSQKTLRFGDKLCHCLRDAMNANRNYYSTVVKILHCWRDKFADIRSRWCDLFGATSAEQFLRKRPPQAISGRWGAVSNGELYILAPPLDEVRVAVGPVICPVLPEQGTRSKDVAAAALPAPPVQPAVANDASGAGGEVDGTMELAVEATKAFKVKAGKWRQDAGLAIQDAVFVPVIVKIMNEARRPLNHFFHWLMQPVMSKVIDGDCRSPGKVAQLVWGKCSQLQEEFSANTDSRQWLDTLLLVPAALREALAEGILTLTLGLHADFDRRIRMLIVAVYPARLLMIAKRGRHIRCAERVGVAEHLLATPDERLEITARKLKLMFGKDLQTIVDTGGQCPGRLWLQVALWSEWMPSDSQYIEGVNNMLLSAHMCAPNIHGPLLSCRVVGRCALLPSGGVGFNYCRFREMEGTMNEMIRRATDAFPQAHNVMEDIYRFASPTPLVAEITPKQPCVPSPIPAVALKWARHYNAKLIDYLRASDGWLLRRLLVLPDPERDGELAFYLAPHVHGWSAHLLRCEVVSR